MPISEQAVPNYQAPTRMTGRMDSLRMHQLVEPVDIRHDEIPQGAFVILGYRCDIGIARNLGRLGAVNGPVAFRERLAAAPVHSVTERRVIDAGDVFVEGTNLESAQQQYAHVVQHVVEKGAFPIGIGGGYDMVWPFVQAHINAHPGEDVAVISLSPFANVRPLEDGQGNSGTEFTQIAEECERRGVGFNYLIYGYQPQVNTIQLEDRLDAVRGKIVDVQDILSQETRKRNAAAKVLKDFIAAHDHVIVTMEVNAFAGAFAPGVSAPTPWGLFPQHGVEIMRLLAESGKLDGVVIAELNPQLDDANASTARLATGLAMEVVEHHRSSTRRAIRN